MNVLTIQNLIKSFGSKKVLCGLELSVQEHSIFGFIGKNGAGKTTTMKAILCLCHNPTEQIRQPTFTLDGLACFFVYLGETVSSFV